MKKIAVVTGANRGLGLALSEALAQRGFKVLMAMRNPDKAQKTLNGLTMKGLDVVPMKLDLSQEKSITDFVEVVKREYGFVDVLINNAGILIDSEDGGNSSLFKTKASTLQKTFVTNTLGPFLLTQKIFPLMKQEGYGRIVNVSSGMAQLSEKQTASASYRISKTGLNMVTNLFASEVDGEDICVNSVSPGWVRTDMGGPHADRSVEQGIKGLLWAATLPKGGPNGGFFQDGEAINW
ncbi:SDR family NAD(P)-dependent oxidoreductase [Bdellovibrio bacteriovorus]|uniref:Short chain dehydrogenase n=1 Tax=Bdellovibrio bacteriovorus (strain ATCC 15356 / DSM 50701 / NCIMB 9529 / HD100) TaxID=264462 RepID=Q6MHI6_BDEBA|nr:SDR family NAD(P)-dependent oxidoreductase [Bdellovibrio bacteriovorus]CAE78346.1 short chain dehydrogenase [Bdellovibrio bacteriovorus HD100]